MVIQESISAQWGTGRNGEEEKNKEAGKRRYTRMSLCVCTILAEIRETEIDRQTDGDPNSQMYKWRIGRLSPRDICQSLCVRRKPKGVLRIRIVEFRRESN